MTTELTPQQQELVAIGASVAASCAECFDAHLGAARAVGLADDELLAEFTSAQAVTAEAAAERARRVRRCWDSPGTDASACGEPCSDLCRCRRAGSVESDAGERRHAAGFSCCG